MSNSFSPFHIPVPKHEEEKPFLQEQLRWVKERIQLLDRIEAKLQEMKNLAEMARDHQLEPYHRAKIQEQMNHLQQEVQRLEEQIKLSIN